jgi:single-stranded DNA-specific DHH superfamily exonuclease
METLLEEKVKPILKDLNIGSIEEIIKDYLLTEILYKISQFKEEIEFFEQKYKKSFEELKKEYENSEEDFQIYDDLMAWEFAIEGFKYWNKRLEELKSVL